MGSTLSVREAQLQRFDEFSQFNLDRFVFYGTLQIPEMLRQFASLQGDRQYDAILLVTDEGSYELADNKKDFPQIDAPLWLVHLGSLFPAYADTVLGAIDDSDGGVATEVSEVLQRMAAMSALGDSIVNVVDGYAWSIDKEATVDSISNSGFESMAARSLVRSLSKQIRQGDFTQLDSIHAIAKRYKIVTPFSSAIVLVNDEQREMLKKAEAEANRFDQKVENGKENLIKPNNPLNAAKIPEPSPIVGVVAIALLFFVDRIRKSPQMNADKRR